MRRKLKTLIPISLITTCFALFFFVFEDLGIRMIFLYAIISLLLCVYLYCYPRLVCSRINIAYVIMAIVAIIFSILPYSYHSYDVTTLMISMLFCSFLALVAKPDQMEMRLMLKVIITVAFCISIYVILIALYPNIYINYIAKFIDEEPRNNTIRILNMHYGVMIGGNVTLINHILVLSLLIVINEQFIYGVVTNKKRVRALLIVLAGLCAMVLENRKGELFVFLLVIAYAFCFGACLELSKRVKKAIFYGFVGILLLSVFFIFAINHGLGERYLKFITNLTSGDMNSTTTGRLTLWSTAIALFKENPIVGIGWGNTRNYISMFNPINQTYIHNVHCVLLQILCETGLVGCFLFMGPELYIIIKMKKTVKKMRNIQKDIILPKLLASVALEYQLFLFLNGMIDSTWHRISFWPFYSISIIMAVSAQRFAKDCYLGNGD